MNFSFLLRLMTLAALTAASPSASAQPASPADSGTTSPTGAATTVSAESGSTDSATARRVAPLRISPEARTILDQVREAYSSLETLEVTGTLTSDSEIAGRVEKSEKPLFGAFRAPDLFLHRIADELLAGSDGKQVYIHNRSRNEVLTAPLGPETTSTTRLPGPVFQLLQPQNPSLLVALARTPMIGAIRDAEALTQLEDEKLEGKRYTTLHVAMPEGRGEVVILVDKETHLIRRVTADLKAGLDRAGVAGVKRARYVVDYTRTRTGRDLDKANFAWSPPANAREMDMLPESSPAGTTTGQNL